MTHPDEQLDTYGDPYITSAHAKVPLWLIISYIILPIIGFIWLYLYWDGSYGWLDPGGWQGLQEAAKTR